MPADLTRLKLLIIDSGYFTFLAQEMAKYYGKVYYCRPTISVFLESRQHSIGKDLPGVEWVDELESYYDKADVIMFPDVNFGPLQMFLQSKGYRICGALGGERMEQDKYYALGKLHSAGFNIPKTWAFVPQNGKAGLDNVWNFVRDKNERLWMKAADKNRGDLDTTLLYDPRQSKIDLTAIRDHVGTIRASEMGVLVQADIPDAVEIGPDLFRNGSQISSTFSVGLEDKGMAYVGRKFSRDQPPGIMAEFLAKTAPIYGELGYRGPYSSEMRVTRDGTVFPIDETARCGNPPTACLVKFYGAAYANAINDVANGRTPDEFDAPHTHFGELILRSDKYEKQDLFIPDVPSLREWLMLKNARGQDGELYCMENGTHGQFGSIVAYGDSIEEVGALLMERVKQLTIPRLEYLGDFEATMRPKIEKAKEYAGVNLDA